MAQTVCGTLIDWGRNDFNQAAPPAGLTNVTAVAIGLSQSLVLNQDTSVVGWGTQSAPGGLTNIIAIASGQDSGLALRADGTVTGWGNTVPNGLANVSAISANGQCYLALRRDGTVVSWGTGWNGNAYVTLTPPADLTNVVAIATAQAHAVALRSDGTVIAWGDNTYGQTNVPTTLTNVIAVAASQFKTVALNADGSITTWGQNSPPPPESNVVAVASGVFHDLYLRGDGTVTGWGTDSYGALEVPASLTNAIAIGAGGWNGAGIASHNDFRFASRQAVQSTVYVGSTFHIQAAIANFPASSYQWRFKGTNISGATNSLLTLSNVPASGAGSYSVIVSNVYGSFVSSNVDLDVLATPPIITGESAPQTAAPGTNVMFFVTVEGSSPFYYQWRLNGTNIVGATNNVLSYPNVQLANGGNYDVVVSNAYGVTYSPVMPLHIEDLTEALDATNLVWVTSGDSVWTSEGTTTHGDSTAAQTGSIDVGQQTTLETTVSGPGTLTFWWSVNAPTLNNYLSFSVDGGEQARIAGVAAWQQQTFYIGAGLHTLRWNYTKTLSVTSWQDAGWLDQVSFAPGSTAPFIKADPASQVVLLGATVTLNVSASGTPPLNYQWQFNQTNMPGATNTTLLVTNAQLTDQGNYRAVISNDYGITNSATALLNVLDVPGALNSTNLSWSSSGNLPWFAETSTTHDGAAALQSGQILNNQQSVVQTTANGPGTLTFWWKVSSETNNDYLNFSIDGVEQARISGLIVNWQQKTYYLSAGLHTLAWTYSKNPTISQFTDAAWLDQVSYVPGSTGAYIATNPVSQVSPIASTVVFSVVAQGTPPLNYQWLFNSNAIPSATNAVLTISNVQISNAGSYSVTVANDFGNASSTNAILSLQNVYAWGAGQTNTIINPNYGQSVIPTNLTGATAIAAGGYHSLALLSSGRVAAWGYSNNGQTNVPVALTNATAIAAGLYHSIALQSNGTVLGWGNSSYNQTVVPAAATNINAVAAGWYHTLALRSNGTVVAWGAGTSVGLSPSFGQSIVPTNLTDVAAIAGGGYHSVALRSNGTVVAWGLNASGQTNVPVGLTNVVAIAAGSSNTLALKSDGTLIAWGNNSAGQTNIPATLSNVVAIAAGFGHDMALTVDGRLTVWGLNGNGQTNVPLVVSNVTAISAGGLHSLARVNVGPISFLAPPQSLTVFKGSNAILTGVALGAGPLGYQWIKNGIAVTDATNNSLTFTPAQLTNSGHYQLVASNTYGAVTSSVTVLTVNDTAPFFPTQPAGQSVLQYSQATLAAAAGGVPPLNYQWRLNGVDIAGATNAMLTISNAQPADEGNYSVFVANAFGTALSSNAFLNVIDVPDALDATNLTWWNIGQPGWRAESTNTHDGFAAAGIALAIGQADTGGLQTVVTGPGTVSFWCQIPAGIAPLYFNVDGAVAASFSGQSLTWRLSTNYLSAGQHILLWNLGNSAVQSLSAKAYLDQVTFVPGAVAPIITSQPVSVTNAAGNSVTFSAALNGTPPMTYQWYFNNTIMPGANSASLTLNNIQAANIGDYSLVISNAIGFVVSSNASLTVTSSVPIITTQPIGGSLMVGGQTTLAVSAKGSTPLFYQWLTNGSPVVGATNSSLTINNAQSSDSAAYSVVVSNSIGAIISSNTFLFVYSVSDLSATLDAPEITWSTTNVPWFPETNVTHDGVSAAQSGVITNTQQSTLQGIATGPATVVYWWKVNCDSFWMNLSFSLNGAVQNAIAGNVDWQSATNYIGAGTQVMQWSLVPTHNAFAGGTGWLDQVQIIPGGTPVAIVSNPASVTNSAGNTVSFSVSAVGTPAFHYQWQFNSADIPNATNATLTLTNIQAVNAGTYAVTVTNDFGFATSSNAMLVVNPSVPVITVQPTSQAAVVNSSVTLTVAVKGTTPFSYQWYFNSNVITGATDNALTLANVQATNSGIYFVVISNSAGFATSTNAWLDVNKTRVFDYWPIISPSYSPPLGLGNLKAIAAGSAHSMGLRSDGTVAVWGSNSYGQTNVPTGLSNVIAIASGDTHCIALTAAGTVAAWGDDRRAQIEVPAGLSNATAISAGPAYTLALKNDGSVVGWGDNTLGQIDIPSNVTNAVAVFAGYYNAFALLPDGSVREWGNGPVWQHNGVDTQLNVESTVSNVMTIAASEFTAWSLQSDGTVQPWGWLDGVGPGSFVNKYTSSSGSYTSSGIGADQRPTYTGVVNVVSSGRGVPNYEYAFMLLNNGIVSQLGQTAASQVSGIPNIPTNPGHAIAIAADGQHALVLVNDGSPAVANRAGVRMTKASGSVTLSAGVVGGWPLSYQWQFNGTNIDGATNAQLVLTNIPLANGGNYQCIVTNSFGAITNSASLSVSRSTPELALGSFAPGIGAHIMVNQLSGHGMTVIYSSTNMSDWKPVFTNSPATGTIDWIDSTATNGPLHFYRAVEQ